MNKRQANQLARSGITYGQLKAMLKDAYDYGEADDRQSTINKGCSKAVAFNIFWKATVSELDNKVVRGINVISAANMLREFGAYWSFETAESAGRFTSAAQPPKNDFYHEDVMDIYKDK